MLGKPDLIIGPRDNPQTERWHIWLPKFLRDKGWQFALHRWHRSDDDRALHDHKADSWSLILWGGYWEVTSHAWEPLKRRWYWPGCWIYRKAEQPHRVLLKPGSKRVWTFWLRAPGRREWGFWCKNGWTHWSNYLRNRDNESTVGRGCDD